MQFENALQALSQDVKEVCTYHGGYTIRVSLSALQLGKQPRYDVSFKSRINERSLKGHNLSQLVEDLNMFLIDIDINILEWIDSTKEAIPFKEAIQALEDSQSVKSIYSRIENIKIEIRKTILNVPEHYDVLFYDLQVNSHVTTNSFTDEREIDVENIVWLITHKDHDKLEWTLVNG